MMKRLKIILCLCVLFNIGQRMCAQTPVKGEKLSKSARKVQTVKETLETDADKSETTENSLAKDGKSDYILTNQAPNRSTSSVASWDFTTGSGQYYGGATGAQELETDVWGMIAGDADGDGQVQNTDKNVEWRSQVGQSGYKEADFNLNGQVQNDDKNLVWRYNVGRGSQVP